MVRGGHHGEDDTAEGGHDEADVRDEITGYAGAPECVDRGVHHQRAPVSGTGWR